MRSNCPLCESMEEELRAFVKEHEIVISRKYIDNEPELIKLYGDKVPVLTMEGDTLCEYFLDPEVLLQAIETSHP